MTGKGSAITLSLNEGDKNSLQEIALQFGQTWGDKPNVSALVEAIAQGKYKVVSNSDWSAEVIEAIEKSRQALIEIGNRRAAIVIANLLVDRSEISLSPLLGVLHNFLAEQPPKWSAKLNWHISEQKPFQLSFADRVTEKILDFSVYYGETVVIDKVEFLRCWCKEVNGKSSLKHNWSICLDQISDAAISEIKGKWRKLDLENIDFRLFGSAALGYLNHQEDMQNDWCPHKPGARFIVRSTTDIFRTFAELRGYGRDCEVIAPTWVAAVYYKEIDRMLARGKRFIEGYAPES
jgi:hypothetical protein